MGVAVTYLRAGLVLVGIFAACVGWFVAAVILLAVAYIILYVQYDSLAQELADTNDFVERLVRGDDE